MSRHSKNHATHQLVTKTPEKGVNDIKLAIPEVFPSPAEVCEQRIGLLSEGREDALLR
jgi:hypothetical protein